MFWCYTTVHVTFQKLSLSFCFPLNLFQSETCVKVHHQLELWSRSRTCNIIHGCLKSSRFDLSQNYPHFFKQTFEQVCTFCVHKPLVFFLFVLPVSCCYAFCSRDSFFYFFLVMWRFKHSKGQTQIPTYTSYFIHSYTCSHTLLLTPRRKERASQIHLLIPLHWIILPFFAGVCTEIIIPLLIRTQINLKWITANVLMGEGDCCRWLNRSRNSIRSDSNMS